jgi:DNA polymerase-3 subunit epsilon
MRTSPLPSPDSDPWGDAPLHALPFAVVDVETTGTRPGGGDRITEIAVVQVQGGAVGEVFCRLVNPGRPIPPHVAALTGITWPMVAGQPAFAAIAPAVEERLGGRVFVAHNAAFDWAFVREELASGTGRLLSAPRLCTVRLARRLVPGLPRRSLDHVTRHFGVRVAARHRAAGDAEATAQVLLRLLDAAADRGITSWRALGRLLDGGARSRAGRSAWRALPAPVLEDDIA